MGSYFYIGQRVTTCYGPGTVKGFERITHINSPIEYPTDYAQGDRLQVHLDNPENWPGHSFTENDPYFSSTEVQP